MRLDADKLLRGTARYLTIALIWLLTILIATQCAIHEHKQRNNVGVIPCGYPSLKSSPNFSNQPFFSIEKKARMSTLK